MQQVLKKFAIRSKVLDECCELVTVDNENNDPEMRAPSECVNPEIQENTSNEWWIVIKLQVEN